MSVALGGFAEVRSNTWGNETHLKLIKPYQTKRAPVSQLESACDIPPGGQRTRPAASEQHGRLAPCGEEPASTRRFRSTLGLYPARMVQFSSRGLESPTQKLILILLCLRRRIMLNPALVISCLRARSATLLRVGSTSGGTNHRITSCTAHPSVVTAKQTAHEIKPSSSEAWGLKYAQLPTASRPTKAEQSEIKRKPR